MLKTELTCVFNEAEFNDSIGKNGFITYLVGPVNYSDVIDNETFTLLAIDEVVDKGYMLENYTIELVSHESQVFAKITANATNWAKEYKNDLKEFYSHL